MCYETDPLAELYDVLAKSHAPEYFVSNFNDGWLYFNPVLDCGFFEYYDYEYQVYCHTWFTNIDSFLLFIENISQNELFCSPAPIFANIKTLYTKNNVNFPKCFYEFEKKINKYPVGWEPDPSMVEIIDYELGKYNKIKTASSYDLRKNDFIKHKAGHD